MNKDLNEISESKMDDMPVNESKLIELQKKIEELKEFSKSQGMDFSYEIGRLEKKLLKEQENRLKNLRPWEKVSIAREILRPTALDYIKYLFTDFLEFKGDRYFGDDPAIVSGIGFFNNIAVTVIGQQKGKSTAENIERNFGMPNPEGYRKALRLMRQAEKFNRPIICFVDTPGAFCGVGAEERGQGEAIASNLFNLSNLKVPIISIVIGEGGSGGALALAVGDRVFMLENSIYSILSPEGFATILWKDVKRASEASEVMKITAEDLLKLNVIEGIIKEPLGGAHKNYEETFSNVKKCIEESLPELLKEDREVLIKKRYERYRNL